MLSVFFLLSGCSLNKKHKQTSTNQLDHKGSIQASALVSISKDTKDSKTPIGKGVIISPQGAVLTNTHVIQNLSTQAYISTNDDSQAISTIRNHPTQDLSIVLPQELGKYSCIELSSERTQDVLLFALHESNQGVRIEQLDTKQSIPTTALSSLKEYTPGMSGTPLLNELSQLYAIVRGVDKTNTKKVEIIHLNKEIIQRIQGVLVNQEIEKCVPYSHVS